MKIEITSEMSVEDIISLAPDSVVLLQNAGLKCTGCDARTERKLSEFLTNMKQEEIEKLLNHLNKLKQVETGLESPAETDLSLEIIENDHGKFYKIAGMAFSQSAYENLHSLADAKGLRINLLTGGCSGFKYSFDYYDTPTENERTYKLSDELELYIDDFTFTRSKGAIIDFSIGLHGSGLQIINPNQKRSCGCGSSFGL
jgi:iron-sulfur cluster assembly accessory protein